MESKLLRNLEIVLVHNVAFNAYYGPERALLDWFEKVKVARLLYVQHPLPPFYTDLASRSDLYSGGRLADTVRAPSPVIKRMLALVVYNAILTIYFVLSGKRRFHVFVGSDGRNALAGLILRELGFVKIVVYLSHSYGEFSNPLTNIVVHWLDRYCARSADFVWNLSRRLTKIREKQGVSNERNVWVPVGIHHDEIQSPVSPPESNQTGKLVFVGVLSPGKGVELIVRALPIILRSVPKIELTIIGEGPLRERLEETCSKLGLQDHIKFLGYMQYDRLMRLLPKHHVGLAVYEPRADSTTLTTDPLKPKLYMACGLPVVITDFPETALEIKQNEAGLVIQYDSDELAVGVVRLLTDVKLFRKCSRNAIKLARRYEWSKIFDKAFLRVFEVLGK